MTSEFRYHPPSAAVDTVRHADLYVVLPLHVDIALLHAGSTPLTVTLVNAEFVLDVDHAVLCATLVGDADLLPSRAEIRRLLQPS